ncbi:MOSC domain-containing protein [Actinomarinicola tropica]|uniref:MOSC domain-containing protein n=1 Tax=Actinomarinicola tropica TaxID=2789776 RepID=A0A5Q2RPA6_9ACTN|nr:MOSC N-terminal beta barrel domain-containing protein [Actinomarinicola tropica]QGG95937.1 MOSC domain-containing protein [Actinomarinicola tropica]
MRITQIWRYPVKSLQGERLESADVDAKGLVGDRRWALFDRGTTNGLTARRVPELLMACGVWHGDGQVSVRLPDGTETADDDELSRWLGREVELRSAAEIERAPVYENPSDATDEDGAPWVEWRGPRGRFHDSTRTMVSICSEASLASVGVPLGEVRRFRFNLVVDGEGEDALVGRHLSIGDVELEAMKRIDRCVMVTRPQPDGIGRDLDVLKRINAARDGHLGIGTLVRSPGRVRVGDELVPL